MAALRLALAIAALVAVAAPHAADAKSRGRSQSSGVQLGLGADWLVDPESGAFQLTFAADRFIAKNLSFGARFGALLFTDPGRVGVPIDARLRFHLDRLYLEGLVGPWLVFDDDDAVRFHGAVGFGMYTRSFQLGLELGVLDPTELVGVRLAFPF